MLEVQVNAIIDTQLIQSNEVGGATHMEKEGLIRSITFLENQDLEIGRMVTDRHVQIRKWLKEERPNIAHYFDIWYIAKSLKKQLWSLSKEKDCNHLSDWVNSIVNHLYWSVISTPPDQPNLIVSKWLSLFNHIVNIHQHSDELFPHCLHPSLMGRADRIKWLKPNSKLMVRLEKIVSAKSLLKDIKQLSGEEQTSSLEAFHSLLNHFAPKTYSFSYRGQLCRTLMAVFHYNENAAREQKSTMARKPRFRLSFPKWKKGQYVVRNILEDPTYVYVETVRKEVIALCAGESDYQPGEEVEEPPPLSSAFQHPDKDTAVAERRSRYQ